MDRPTDSSTSWGKAFSSLLCRQVISLLFLGFSAGLPLLLIFSSLSLWLREAGVERGTVTFFSWAALGYSFKFVWAPLIDRIRLPVLHRLLGRRRSWMLLSQIFIIVSLLFMANHDPIDGLFWVACGAVMLGFSSATQDIVIDAYRIEAADEALQAMMSSSYIAGYRVGMLVAGAGTLALASWFSVADVDSYDYLAWAFAYRCMAVFMSIGVMTTFLVSEPAINVTFEFKHSTSEYLRFLLLFVCTSTVFVISFTQLVYILDPLKIFLMDFYPQTPIIRFVFSAIRFVGSVTAAALIAWILIKVQLIPKRMVEETYLAPFSDFFERYGKAAIHILLLVSIYRISDIVMGTISNVFYSDMGYTKEQIATITKTFGLFVTIAGGIMGGILVMRYGVIRILWIGALVAALSNVLFAILVNLEPSSVYLILVIVADNISGGLASAAFIAFLSSLTNKSHTAMQYSIFSSLMTLLPKLLAGYSGTFVDTFSYPVFFIGSALLGLPVIWLIFYVKRLL